MKCQLVAVGHDLRKAMPILLALCSSVSASTMRRWSTNGTFRLGAEKEAAKGVPVPVLEP